MSQSRREIWTERMARYRDCSLTVREFCAREGVSQPSFYQWKKKLAELSIPRSELRTGFVSAFLVGIAGHRRAARWR